MEHKRHTVTLRLVMCEIHLPCIVCCNNSFPGSLRVLRRSLGAPAARPASTFRDRLPRPSSTTTFRDRKRFFLILTSSATLSTDVIRGRHPWTSSANQVFLEGCLPQGRLPRPPYEVVFHGHLTRIVLLLHFFFDKTL